MIKTATQIVEQALPHMINSARNVLQCNIAASPATMNALSSEIVRTSLQYLVELLEARDTQLANAEELHGYALEHGSAYTVLHNAGGRGACLDIMARDAIRIAYENGKADGKREALYVPAL